MTAETAFAPCGPAPEDIDQTFDDSIVIDLVASARDGDAQAWDATVDRVELVFGQPPGWPRRLGHGGHVR